MEMPRLVFVFLLLLIGMTAVSVVATAAKDPTPIKVDCASSTYTTSTCHGKVDCDYDMSNCNGNTPFLWGPVGSQLLAQGEQSATCFGNLVTGVSSVSSFSYVLGLHTEGELPLDEETQAYIVRVSDGAILDCANILNLESVNDTDSYCRVTAVFPKPPKLDPSCAYALYFCYVSNSSVYSDLYTVNLYQSQHKGAPNHVASCRTFEQDECYPCFTTFDDAADRDIYNEFATTIRYTCPACPAPTPSPIPSPCPCESPFSSPSPTRSPSPSASASAWASASPSSSPSPSASPSAGLIIRDVTNVSIAYNNSTPQCTIRDPTSTTSYVVAGFSGLGAVGGGSLGNNVTISAWNLTHSTANGTDYYTYTASIGSAQLQLGYQQSQVDRILDFGGSAFSLPQGASKWTVTLSGGWPFGSQNSFQLKHSISRVDGATLDAIYVLPNYPSSQITTYVIYSNARPDLSIKLQTFDFALVDDVKTAITHNVTVAGTQATFTIDFPRCQNIIFYDPSLNIASVEIQKSSASPSPGDKASSGGGGSDDTIGLAVGLGVGLGGALLCILLILLVGLVVFLARKGSGGKFDITIFSSDV